MTRKRTKVLVVLAGTLLVFLAVHFPQQTRAVEPPDPDRVFSPVAFAFGQTARVNIAQIGDPNDFPAGSVCGIIINDLSADGTSLTSPFRGAKTRRIAFADEPFSTIYSMRSAISLSDNGLWPTFAQNASSSAPFSLQGKPLKQVTAA